MPVLVGTSGWQYRDWRGAFYPPDVPQRRWLEFYAGKFGTVENNATFYRLPARTAFEGWRTRTPDGFVMALKASRYLTHVRRLRDPAEPVRRMLDAFGGLAGKRGPVLIQLPPTLAADPALLDDCLARFPPDVRVAVEPRHPSWWSDAIRAVLAARGAALCWADRRGQPVTPLWRTVGWGYVRFHEGTADPWPRYGERALGSWAELIARTWPPDAPVYAYFNNDQNAAAVADAAVLARLAALWYESLRHIPGAGGRPSMAVMRYRRFLVAAAMASLAGCHVTAASPAASPAHRASSPAPASTEASADSAGLVVDHDPRHVTGTLTGTCQYHDGGQLPDPRCTPGSIDPAVTQANIHRTICVAGYTKKVRPPAEQTDRFKYDVAYPAYGTPHSRHTELDHLVSLELGGSNDAANLWPEYPPTPNRKDKVENALHRAVCEGRVSLAAAQRAIARDWMTAEATLGLR